MSGRGDSVSVEAAAGDPQGRLLANVRIRVSNCIGDYVPDDGAILVYPEPAKGASTDVLICVGHAC